MKYLYRLYQLVVCVPVVIIWSIIISLMIIIGCALGGGKFWGYYPGKWWGWLIVRIFLLPVKVEGKGLIERDQSYVFVANHQGAFDIFLIYGFLGRNIRWMMKHQILKIPFVGTACKASRQIIIDKRGPKRIKASYDQAREILKEGVSLMVFPEGARTFTGHMGHFTRGAFMLADELQLPVVPITINGSFNVMPRTNDWHFVNWHPLSITVHQPIYPIGEGSTNIASTMTDSYSTVMADLVPEYQGYVENPDQ
jgi:1-acyl-sn-glycerol-3-phosphate acyltransferase